MVNNYIEEKNQQVYFLLDKSRSMNLSFNGMSFIDYAINSTLVLSNIALQKNDKVGMISYSDKLGSFIKPNSGRNQLSKILNSLYSQKTRAAESDFELLYSFTKRHITNRSLLIWYTNFESLDHFRTNISYIRKVGFAHILIVVVFNNTEILDFVKEPATNLKEIYTHTLADDYQYQKNLMQSELEKFGIKCLLVSPDELNINVINQYLRVKSSGLT